MFKQFFVVSYVLGALVTFDGTYGAGNGCVNGNAKAQNICQLNKSIVDAATWPLAFVQ